MVWILEMRTPQARKLDSFHHWSFSDEPEAHTTLWSSCDTKSSVQVGCLARVPHEYWGKLTATGPCTPPLLGIGRYHISYKEMLPQGSMLYDRSNPSFPAPALLREWQLPWLLDEIAAGHSSEEKASTQYRPSPVHLLEYGSRPPLSWIPSSEMRPLHPPGSSTLHWDATISIINIR